MHHKQVQGLFIGLVAAFVVFITMIGPEYVFRFEWFSCILADIRFRNHSSHFEHHKTAFEEGAANDDATIEPQNSPKDEEKPTEIEKI